MNLKRNPVFERAAVVLWMALVALRNPGLSFIEARWSATSQLLTSRAVSGILSSPHFNFDRRVPSWALRKGWRDFAIYTKKL